MKIIKFIILFLIISPSVFAQIQAHTKYVFTRVGTPSFNELNVGYGFKKAGPKSFEILVGFNFGSKIGHNSWLGERQIFSTRRIRTNTAVKGLVIRPTVYYGENNTGGVSGIFRIGVADGFKYRDGRYSNPITVFDTGVLFTTQFANDKKLSSVLSLGPALRFIKTSYNLSSYPGWAEPSFNLLLIPVVEFSLQYKIFSKGNLSAQ